MLTFESCWRRDSGAGRCSRSSGFYFSLLIHSL